MVSYVVNEGVSSETVSSLTMDTLAPLQVWHTLGFACDDQLCPPNGQDNSLECECVSSLPDALHYIIHKCQFWTDRIC